MNNDLKGMAMTAIEMNKNSNGGWEYLKQSLDLGTISKKEYEEVLNMMRVIDMIDKGLVKVVGETAPKDIDHINPSHYKKLPKETWEIMLFIWGKEAFITHCQMTAFKYRMRMGDKQGQDYERDFSKAKWYEDKVKELSSPQPHKEYKDEYKDKVFHAA